ncbi:MAG: chemotaxis protein CheB [Lysobacterales bacterium]
MSTEITVALVFEQEEGVTALKAALANAGVRIAAECKASALDAQAILSSGADAIVVNLDADLADLLDDVTDALDASERPVIFNDPSASSDLSGWDRARWMRHLSAKLKGNSDVTPPAPPGSQSIPVPVSRKPVVPTVTQAPAEVAEVDMPDMSFALEAEPENLEAGPEAAEPGFDELSFSTPELPAEAAAESADGMADLLDLNFEAESEELPGSLAEDQEFSLDTLDLEVSVEDVGTAPPAARLADTLELAVDDLQPEPAAGSLTMGDEIDDLDALFDEPFSPDDAVTAVEQPASDALDELDSMFSTAAEVEPAVQNLAAPDELTDLDAMFREFEASQSAEAETKPEPEPAKSEPAEKPAFKGMSDALNWSLEPVEESKPETPARSESEPIFEWRLDGGPAPKAAPPTPAAPVKPPKADSAPPIPADLEASLALADFRLMDDDAGSTASPGPSVDDFDSLDLSSIEMDLGEVEQTGTVRQSEADSELGFAELDFDLDLEVADTSAMDVAAGTSSSEDDLDTLFVAPASASQPGLNLPDLNRLFVLGASIGGPEAIKTFLSRIPGDVAAAFVVAQHMGAEFLEMMAAQLDSATKLNVRYPKPGERLRHGEVVVAPAGEQISIDDSGSLQFSAVSASTPYSPSIDQLVRSATDRFGDQVTLILFSGMGTDAVEGGRYLSDHGGQVWAQDRGSCVIASMIDAAKAQGIVKFEGTPAQLAERVLEVLG